MRVTLFSGEPMTIVLPEVVSQRIYEYRIWEPRLTRLFYDHIKPGWVVFDVGAHFGYFSLLASGLGAEVHAFEPTPSTAELLRHNVGSRVRVNEAALWSEKRSVTIADFGLVRSAFNTIGDGKTPDQGVRPTIVDVPATTIDDYVSETGTSPDFIKLDVESVEEHVLNGAKRTLALKKPLVTVEVGKGDKSRRLLEGMMSLHYRPFNITTEGVSPHALRESYSHDNILLIPDRARDHA